jgi:small-conductance mechanosensitive channel
MKNFISFFHDAAHAIFPSVFLAFIALFSLLTTVFIGIYFFSRYIILNYLPPRALQFTHILIKNIKFPLLFLSSLLSFYITLTLTQILYPQTNDQHYSFILKISTDFIIFTFLVTLFWLIWQILSNLQTLIHTRTKLEKHPWFTFLFSLMSNGIRAALILLVANLLIPWLGLTPFLQTILEKASRILLIATFGWIFFHIVNGGAKIILSQYGVEHANEPSVRKVRTQVIILKRVVLTIVGVMTCGAILLVFDSVKHLGAGLLTTAGVIGAVGAFASQHSLSRLAAGLQMAFTQPIRIGDTVTIDNELGVIEEISLSYVVIKLWDLRRLILPIDYLNTKGFHNLSRTSTQLLDSVFLYVDFTFPVEPIRKKFFELIEQSSFWDHQIKALHVTAITDSSMELRALMSAKDSATLWELRCEMREKLVDFIVKNYSDYLPTQRQTRIEVVDCSGND